MRSSPNHVPLPVSPVAGVKRPAPSLLPAFEPSSSPQLPRSIKRFAHASPSKAFRERSYPTPVPTSSTLIPSSSPPRLPGTRCPGLQRTLSAFSERAPLATVPSIELSGHGEPILMGRSSNSSHYQLSTNKLISRIHVRAIYVPADPPASAKVKVECMGWNGVKVHCQGKPFELGKGDTFTSETEDADIMIDVQDARVLLTWPKHENKISTPTDTDLSWDSENSPQRAATAAARNRPPYTSPLRQQARLQSPISPSPAVQATHVPVGPSTGHGSSNPPIPVPVQVYEDEPSEEGRQGSPKATQSTQFASQPLGNALQEMQSIPLQDFSDNDEENDPIITSFGPFGANLGARMESFTTNASPLRHPLGPLKEESISPQRVGKVGISPKRRRHNQDRDVSDSFQNQQQQEAEKNPITNHVINQLAYSRLSSTPLSTIFQSLPAHLKAQLDSDRLRSLLECIQCAGEVPREGKDAAGKQLESEYYYIPEGDADEARRETVEGLGEGVEELSEES
ncbi:hypothetical protein ABVK25_011112 [Lepraria finkii]|uniref:FHA domain-containing protein n=1 Tax=Lepraria finkii TaxID=1340010 RepID=A0ABR4ATC5_9LECA